MASIADVYVTVLPETARLKEEIRKAVNQAERQGIKIGVEANTVDADKELQRFRTSQERTKIRQRIELDESGLRGKLNLLSKEFEGVGAKMGGALKLNLGLVGVGLLPAAATAITDVAGAIQQLSGAGLVLPGVMAGIASSFGVAKLSTLGVKEAFEALDKAADGTEKSVQAANAALAGLAPNVADTVKTAYGLKGTFEDLRNIGGQNLFAGVSDGLKGLVGNLLPTATRGIDGISKALNQNLLGAMDALGSSSSQGLLDRIFGNTANAQGRLTAAIDPVIKAVGTLAAAGSDSLPRLADAIGAVATRFSNFITSADADGRLSKWISEGLDGFTNLGNILLNLGKSFLSITQAAGGGAGLLGTLESLTARMATFLGSSEGQNRLKQFFADGRNTLGQLKDIAVQLGPILGGVFRAGMSAAQLWLPVIREVLRTINSIPGGAAAVVGAFTAWKTISGVSSLAIALGNVSKLLGFSIPAAAASGSAAAAGSLGGIAAAARSAMGPVAALSAALLAVTNGRPQDFVGMGPNSPGNAAREGDWWETLFGRAGGPLKNLIAPTATRPDYRLSTAIPAPADGSNQFGGPGAQAARRGNTPRPPTAAAVPSSVAVPPMSTYTEPVITDYSGSGGSGGGKTGADFMGGYTSDSALLANVPAGSYSEPGSGNWDLTKGLADCSSAVEDLVNMMDGTSTAGRSMATGNAAEWLAARGFVPGSMPGAFNVGFNSSHMQATLPGGTPFNWGSNAAAARGGVGGSGASDPAFTQHFYRPVAGGAGGAGVSAAYPEMGSGDVSSYMTGDPAQDKRVRDAGQRVTDTGDAITRAQMKYDAVLANGKSTALQRKTAEDALTKAKREHTDAQTDLNTAIQKGDSLSSKAGGTGGEQLGQDILSGMGEVLGLGTLFKDPTQFGLFKMFKGVMGLKFADGQTQGGDGASLFPSSGGGGGGGLLDSVMGLIPQPFGAVKSGSPADAPGQFMPAMPNGGGGGIVAPGNVMADPNSPPGAAGPGNVNDFRGANFGYSPTVVQDQVNSAHLQQTRQPMRSLPK